MPRISKPTLLVALVILAYCKPLHWPNFRFVIGDEGSRYMLVPLLDFTAVFRTRLVGCRIVVTECTSGRAFPNCTSALGLPVGCRRKLSYRHVPVPRCSKSHAVYITGDVVLLFTLVLHQSHFLVSLVSLASCPCLRFLLLAGNDFQVENETASTEFARALGADSKQFLVLHNASKAVRERSFGGAI